MLHRGLSCIMYVKLVSFIHSYIYRSVYCYSTYYCELHANVSKVVFMYERRTCLCMRVLQCQCIWDYLAFFPVFAVHRDVFCGAQGCVCSAQGCVCGAQGWYQLPASFTGVVFWWWWWWMSARASLYYMDGKNLNVYTCMRYWCVLIRHSHLHSARLIMFDLFIYLLLVAVVASI